MGPHPLLREKNPSRFGEVGQVWSGEMRAINPEGNHHMHPTHYRDGITHIRSFFIPRKNKKSWYMYVVWSGPSEFLFFPLQSTAPCRKHQEHALDQYVYASCHVFHLFNISENSLVGYPRRIWVHRKFPFLFFVHHPEPG